MTRSTSSAIPVDTSSADRALCPSWCVAAHDRRLGEDDWLHTGEPVAFETGLSAELVVSIDPDTGAADGPFVVIGDTELTPAEASALATRLLALTAMASVHDRAPRHEWTT